MNKSAAAGKASPYAAFHRTLLRWYEAHGRHDLPWRNTDDPYAIYLSEIMLQQTQVATVLERFYHPFLKRFPTLQSLGKASEQDVLHAWQGLGYYSRARNLHRAAQQAGKSLPRDVEGLMGLPGIGRNTAHAVAAFAFRQPVPVMEANVKRVLHRVFARHSASDAELWELAHALLDDANPFDYNQAMMDLGSAICTPRAPKCAACPASTICQGQKEAESFPQPKTRRTPPLRRAQIVLCRDTNGRLHAKPRTTRLLGGLYEFPTLAAEEKQLVLDDKKLPLSKACKLGEVKQVYSHFTLLAEILLLESGQASSGPNWHLPKEVKKLPLSGLERKILALLEAGLRANLPA